MLNWLNKIMNVRPGEWSKLLILSGIMLMSNLGPNWGMTVAYAAFLKGAGVETLIWVMLISSLLSIPVLAIYAAFVDRINNNRLFAYIIIIEALVILAGMGLLALNWSVIAFSFVYILALACVALFNTHFFTYINEIYDIQTAKRALPLILATGRIGSVIAGFSLPFITQALSSSAIIWIWLVNDLVVIGMIWAIPFILKDIKKPNSEVPIQRATSAAKKEGNPYLENLKEGLAFTLQSKFLRWMAAGTLFLTILMTLLEYHVNAILVPQFKPTVELAGLWSVDFAGFLGILNGVANLVALLILLFGISRLTKAWGVGNTSLAFPAITLAISGGLALAPNLLTASLAHLSRRGLRFSLLSPIESLLYNAISFRIKGRARAFVGGLLAPVGVILGSLVLFGVVGFSSDGLIAAMIAAIAVAYLLSALQIRKEYSQALVKMLEEEDYSFLLSDDASELAVADPKTLERLKKKLDESDTHEMRVFMAQLIAQVGGTDAVSVLAPAIKATQDVRTQAAMLSVLTASDLQGEQVQSLYMDYLSSKDSQVRQAAASGLVQLMGNKNTWLQGQLLGMTNDSDAQVSLQALRFLANTGEFYKFNDAVKKLEKLTKSNSLEQQINAIDILGKIARPQAIEQLLNFMGHEDDQIRLGAVLELENLPLPMGNILDEKILEKIRLLQHDPVARVRESVVILVGKFKRKTDYRLLISMMNDSNPQVRKASADILVKIGKDTLPDLQAELKSANIQTHQMAAVVLSRINPGQFKSLIDAEITDNLKRIYHNIADEIALNEFEQFSSARVLQAALRDVNRDMAEEILYFLSAIHGPESLATVQESLENASSSVRTLAAEALESLTSPKTGTLIASLFDKSIERSNLLEIGQELLAIETVDSWQVIEATLFQAESKILGLLSLRVLSDLLTTDLQESQKRPPASRAAQILEDLGTPASQETDSSAIQSNLPELLTDLQAILEKATTRPNSLVQQESQELQLRLSEKVIQTLPLSIADKVIVLKETLFFRNVPINQLEILAAACEEKKYPKEAHIFRQGEPGGILCIVVQGQVGIEQERRTGAALLATIESGSYFGEMSLFDTSRRSASAIALSDCVILELSRAPITTLTIQNPGLALELINVLSQRIRETSERIADTARSRPRELHKLFDQFD